jgi:hypothetical protein
MVVDAPVLEAINRSGGRLAMERRLLTHKSSKLSLGVLVGGWGIGKYGMCLGVAFNE